MITLGMSSKNGLKKEVLREEDVHPNNYRSKSEANNNSDYWWDKRYHQYKSELSRRNNLKAKALEILIDLILDADNDIDRAVSDDIPKELEAVKFTEKISLTRCQYDTHAALLGSLSENFTEGTSSDNQIRELFSNLNFQTGKDEKTFVDHICNHNISRSELVPLKGLQTWLLEKPYQYYIIYKKRSPASEAELYVADSVKSCLKTLKCDIGCIKHGKSRIRRDYLYQDNETGKYYFFEAKNMESSGLTGSVVHDLVKYAYALHNVVDNYNLEIIYNGDLESSALEAIQNYRETEFDNTEKALQIGKPQKIDDLVRSFDLDIGGLLFDGDNWFTISKEVGNQKYGYDEIVVDLRYDTDYSVLEFQEDYSQLIEYLEDNVVADIEEVNNDVFPKWSQDKTISFVESVSSIQKSGSSEGLDDYMLTSSVKHKFTEEDLNEFVDDYLDQEVKENAEKLEERFQ